MISEALRIMDRNTERLMIDEWRQELAETKKQLQESQEAQQRSQQEAQKQILEAQQQAQQQILETKQQFQQQLAEKDALIAELQKKQAEM